MLAGAAAAAAASAEIISESESQTEVSSTIEDSKWPTSRQFYYAVLYAGK